MRGPDYEAHPPLDRLLVLPDGADAATDGRPTARAAIPGRHAGRTRSAEAAWSAALGGRPVLLVRSVERARAALLRAAGVQSGEPVGVPANATNALVEAVKRHGARPHFLDIGADLALLSESERPARPRIAWAEPVGGLTATGSLVATCRLAQTDSLAQTGGLAQTGDLPGVQLWVDHADSLPMPTPSTPPARVGPVTLWGLHLSDDANQAGALLAFATESEGAALHAAVADQLGPDDQPDPALALAQYHRLVGDGHELGLAVRQRDALAATHRGLREAAGLPLLPLDGADALSQHVAVRIPDESDVSTFYAYVRGENTPVRWLPEVRPLHHAALRAWGPAACADTAARLARWLLVPVGPGYADAEIDHPVLGVVKASEYLGVRWRTDPARAAAYAAMLDDWYGPDHDAYRPVFELSPPAP